MRYSSDKFSWSSLLLFGATIFVERSVNNKRSEPKQDIPSNRQPVNVVNRGSPEDADGAHQLRDITAQHPNELHCPQGGRFEQDKAAHLKHPPLARHSVEE